MKHCLPSRAAALAAALSILSTAPAQGPEGRIVVAAEGASVLGPGGLFLANPTGGNQRPTVVTGLPAELVGTPLDGVPHGASAVLVRPDDQKVVVGSSAETGGEVALFTIDLDGATASTDRRLLLGHNTSGDGSRSRGVQEVAELPNGELLAVLDAGVTADAGGTQPVQALVIPATGNSGAAPFPIQPGLGAVDLTGVAVSDGAVFFAAVTDAGLPSASTEIFSTPLTGGTRSSVATNTVAWPPRPSSRSMR